MIFRSLAVASVALGCAATSPMLAEPRIVREGDVRFQVGAAAVAPVGGDLAAVRAGRERLDAPEVVNDDPATTQALLPAIAIGFAARPGVAPVMRATMSLSKDLEANVHYSGRDAHVGARYLLWERRSEDAGALTLSIGGDGHALLRGRPQDGYINATSETVRGWGVAVPAILGYQSDAGLFIAYVGALVGYERISATILYQKASAVASHDLTLGRLHVTGTAGIGVGFRRVRVILELGVRRDSIAAKLGDETRNVGLISLTPAFALGINF